MNNIDLKKIKVVIFDFDDTLAIHKDPNFSITRGEREENYISFYEKAYKYPEIFYEEIEPCYKSERMFNFIKELRNNNIKMYCLSGMKFSFHLKAKQAFINKYYGNDIEIIITSTQELKVPGVKIIQKICNCNLDEILFIDDLEDTVNYLNSNGIRAINVDEFNEWK